MKNWNNKTYELLLAQAEMSLKQEKKKERIEKQERAQQQDKMQDVISVSILEKINLAEKSNWLEDYYNFKYRIENKTDKEIKDVFILFKIYDSLGKLIDNYDFVLDVLDVKIPPHCLYENIERYYIYDRAIFSPTASDLSFDITVNKIVYHE